MFRAVKRAKLLQVKPQFNMESRDLLTNIDKFSKEELVGHIHRLQTQVSQLKNVVAKQNILENHKNVKSYRDFNFNIYKKRRVALKMFYFGWNYDGLSAQETTQNTIEAHLFNALQRARLVESRQTCNYHRCGRTDKGVSAFSQVVSLELRSQLLSGDGVFDFEGYTASPKRGNTTDEIDYPKVLNAVLPEDIKILAWCPVDESFSARFSCNFRTYKYIFPLGNLNIENMKEGLKNLHGVHDFRNFCKFDANVPEKNFVRSVTYANIEKINFSSMPSSYGQVYDMYELTIKGKAFLWHQIRCIVTILLYIGYGKEHPNIIKELLDIETNPLKPDYELAYELPLILYDCEYDDLQWKYSLSSTEILFSHMQRIWTKSNIQSAIISKMLHDVTDIATVHRIKSKNHQTSSILRRSPITNHNPIMKRQKCKCPDEKMNNFHKKKKFKDNDVKEED